MRDTDAVVAERPARERREKIDISGPSVGRDDAEGHGEASRHDSHAVNRVTPLAGDIERERELREGETAEFTRGEQSGHAGHAEPPIRTWCVTRPHAPLRRLVGFDLAVVAARRRDCLEAAPWVSELIANHVIVLALTTPLSWERRPRRSRLSADLLVSAGYSGVYVDAPGQAGLVGRELTAALAVWRDLSPAAVLAASAALPPAVLDLAHHLGPHDVLAEFVSPRR